MSTQTILALVALVASGIGTAAALVWKLSRVELALRTAIDAAQREVDERQDRLSRDFGETAAALRQKIVEVELFARDTFLRRDDFVQVQRSMSNDMRALGDDLKAWLLRIEKKIDDREKPV